MLQIIRAKVVIRLAKIPSTFRASKMLLNSTSSAGVLKAHPQYRQSSDLTPTVQVAVDARGLEAIGTLCLHNPSRACLSTPI
jgi:hypothetical protein